MSLFSVDKSGHDRKNPQPNQVDHDSNRKAHNTMGITMRTDNNVNYQRVVFKNGLTLSYDDQNRVIKIDGFEPRLALYPVVIEAKYGYDVYVDILGLTAPTT
jgi:hypothetical protein